MGLVYRFRDVLIIIMVESREHGAVQTDTVLEQYPRTSRSAGSRKRETHTLGKGDTQTQRMQMEFRTQKRERLRRAASSTGATGLGISTESTNSATNGVF